MRAPKVAVVDVKLRDGMAFGLIDLLHDLGVRVVVVSGFAAFSTLLGNVAEILQKSFSGNERLATLCTVVSAI